MSFTAFIEKQFPVSKVSKESYKERKANNSQTLTGLGKWWGRKPLVLVRATLIGLLLPATDEPDKDQDVFLRLMTMDEDGLLLRREKNFPVRELAALLPPEATADYLANRGQGKWAWRKGVSQEAKQALQEQAFQTLSYDDKLRYCRRPEQIEGPAPESWAVINAHCGTTAQNLPEWVAQMGQRQFGHTPRVGDAFCGGGSIPFEAARLGCAAYGSDLNPVAALLTWAALNIVGGGEEVKTEIEHAQRKVFDAVDQQITDWGIEHNEQGWRADAYLYCIEARSPATGYWVPLAPSWVISEKQRVCAVLSPDHEHKRYRIEVVEEADKTVFEAAKTGTVQDSRLVCPETGNDYAIDAIRGDKRVDGQNQYGLRQWENDDLTPRPEDTFQERLYCIRYVETYYLDMKKGQREYTKQQAEQLPHFQAWRDSKRLKEQSRRHYMAPDAADLQREAQVLELLRERFARWQEKGFIPSARIPTDGDKTEEPIRTRGWTYWHHLFSPRQLLAHGCFSEQMNSKHKRKVKAGFLLGIGKFANWNSKLCKWTPNPSNEGGLDVFSNQALNTLYNYSVRAMMKLGTVWNYNISDYQHSGGYIETKNSSAISSNSDFWLTDPPYADAINYHELGDFFLAWYEKHLGRLFPEWHTDSKAALAVKGRGQSFNRSMVEVYRNLAKHMPDNGAQVVMFTHQDAGVWADLALILWAAGLRVTAAWTIQTETDAGGIKKGNYVQGTVIMVLRKRDSEEMGFLSDIQMDVEHGVREQIEFMRQLDDQEQPNFGDADYQLAAYAAALRELTRYQQLDEIDVEYELSKVRKPGEENEIIKIINSAVRVAMDCLVPNGMPEADWRKLEPTERFYLKGLEVEQSGEYRSGVYTEMARGYGLQEYKHLLQLKSNETRLRTPLEFKTKELGKAGFGQSLTRQVLFAIYECHRTENPAEGRNWLKSEWPDYWGSRRLILSILRYISTKTSHIAHWQADAAAAELLHGYLENDTMG